jgi:hypothetical protein
MPGGVMPGGVLGVLLGDGIPGGVRGVLLGNGIPGGVRGVLLVVMLTACAAARSVLLGGVRGSSFVVLFDGGTPGGVHGVPLAVLSGGVGFRSCLSMSCASSRHSGVLDRGVPKWGPLVHHNVRAILARIGLSLRTVHSLAPHLDSGRVFPFVVLLGGLRDVRGVPLEVLFGGLRGVRSVPLEVLLDGLRGVRGVPLEVLFGGDRFCLTRRHGNSLVVALCMLTRGYYRFCYATLSGRGGLPHSLIGLFSETGIF